MSFILRFWLEDGHEGPTWRGRIVEVREEETEFYVQDGAGLYGFISGKLSELGGVVFPYSLLPPRGESH